MMYMMDVRDTIMHENPDVKLGDVMKYATEKFKKLTEEEQQVGSALEFLTHPFRSAVVCREVR